MKLSIDVAIAANKKCLLTLRYLINNPLSIFLADGLGALVSTMLLVVVMHFENIFGMPNLVFKWLIPLALIFSVYSLACFFIKPAKWQPWLLGIAMANILYCMVTLTLIVANLNALTRWGLLYFSAEILVILLLAALELKIVNNKMVA